jgi:hypothetical protein
MLLSIISGVFREIVRLFCPHEWLIVGIEPDGIVREACRLCWHDRSYVP